MQTEPLDNLGEPPTKAANLPSATRPWQRVYPYTPPPAPRPRHIRRIHGRWRVWKAFRDDFRTDLEYGWSPLDPDLSSYLDDVTTLQELPSGEVLPGVPEELPAGKNESPTAHASRPRYHDFDLHHDQHHAGYRLRLPLIQ